MNNQSLNNQGFPKNAPKRVGRPRFVVGKPWWWLILVLVLHTVVGIFLSVFSPPSWVWPLAFGGTFIQAVVLAGPRALSSLKGFQILLCRFVTCVGTALSVVALAVAVGFGGTDDIDRIQFSQTGLALLLINLGVLVLTATCSLMIAHAGDRLLAGMGRGRCSLFVLSFCFLGLFIGGMLGLAIAS